jgi:hypothetical protein
MHDEKPCNLYASPNIRVTKLRRIRWAEDVECMGTMRNLYRILVREPEGKMALRRPMCR